jgi:hypothetical protein
MQAIRQKSFLLLCNYTGGGVTSQRAMAKIQIQCRGISLSALYRVSYCRNSRVNFVKKSCLLEILLNIFFTVSDVQRGKGKY